MIYIDLQYFGERHFQFAWKIGWSNTFNNWQPSNQSNQSKSSFPKPLETWATQTSMNQCQETKTNATRKKRKTSSSSHLVHLWQETMPSRHSASSMRATFRASAMPSVRSNEALKEPKREENYGKHWKLCFCDRTKWSKSMFWALAMQRQRKPTIKGVAPSATKWSSTKSIQVPVLTAICWGPNLNAPDPRWELARTGRLADWSKRGWHPTIAGHWSYHRSLRLRT